MALVSLWLPKSLICGKQVLESIFLNVPVWPLCSSRIDSYPKFGLDVKMMWHSYPTRTHLPCEYEKVYYIRQTSQADLKMVWEQGKETGLEFSLWLWGGAGVRVPICEWAEACVVWISHWCQRRARLSFLISVPRCKAQGEEWWSGLKMISNQTSKNGF